METLILCLAPDILGLSRQLSLKPSAEDSFRGNKTSKFRIFEAKFIKQNHWSETNKFVFLIILKCPYLEQSDIS